MSSSPDSSEEDSFLASSAGASSAPPAAAAPPAAGPDPTPLPMFEMSSVTLTSFKAPAKRPGQNGSQSTLAAYNIQS